MPATSIERKRARLAAIGLNSFQSEMFNWNGGAGYQIRDHGMADILAERISTNGGKSILWAADLHIGGAILGTGADAYKTMGTWLTERFDYLPVALTAYDLKALCNGPCLPELPQEADSLAAKLHQVGRPYLLLDLQSTYLPAGQSCSLRQLGSFVPADHYRAAIFLENSPAITPE